MRKKSLQSLIDIGGRAEHYATRPYGHYKKEVYRLFVDILTCLPERSRILDVGAGPGHLACEFFKRSPESQARWVLVDSSAELLKIARSRLEARGHRTRTLVRDFNDGEWSEGLPRFDAIVSNNALFSLSPGNLKSFYTSCCARTKKDGILLNQQSFAFEGEFSPYGPDRFARNLRALPESILPKLPGLTRKEKEKLEREKRAAKQKHDAAVAEARAKGIELPAEMSYQWLTVEHHLEVMRRVGYACGAIWRKREFAVILGIKGEPFKA